MLRVPAWIVVAFVVAVPSVMWAAEVVLPHVFVSGTTIRAAEVNANFDALRTEVSRGVRFSFVGGGASAAMNGGTVTYYTTLTHPLLDGNPDAFVFVTPADSGESFSCMTARAEAGDPQAFYTQFVDYAGGRWRVWATCPGVRYRVLAFSGE